MQQCMKTTYFVNVSIRGQVLGERFCAISLQAGSLLESLRSSTFGDGKNTGFCAEGSGPAAQVQERPPSPLLR